MVQPQKERVFQRLLDGDGFATFVPLKTEWRFTNAVTRIKVKKREVQYPLMPRYVFVGMNTRTPGWASVFRFDIIRPRVISLQGHPYEIPNGPLYRLMRSHNQGRFNAPDAHRYMQTHQEFEVNDRVLVEGGLFEGRVVEITGRIAKVLVGLLGGQEINVELDKLVPA